MKKKRVEKKTMQYTFNRKKINSFVHCQQNSENEDLDPHERKKLRKMKAMSDSEEDDEEDDEERLREEIGVSK